MLFDVYMWREVTKTACLQVEAECAEEAKEWAWDQAATDKVVWYEKCRNSDTEARALPEEAEDGPAALDAH